MWIKTALKIADELSAKAAGGKLTPVEHALRVLAGAYRRQQELIVRLHEVPDPPGAGVPHLREVEVLLEAAKLALEELRHAPCRDNRSHTLCLKCAAQRKLEEALATWGELLSR